MRKVELESGKSQILATFQKQSQPGIELSFSPDLKSVASTLPLQLTMEAGELRTINVTEATGHYASKIDWAADSSKFFAAYSDTIDILDAQGKKIGGGALLKGSYVRAGWFDAEQKSLFLFLVTEIDESGGPLVRCRIANWRCARLLFRQEFTRAAGQTDVQLHVSPSAARAVLSWSRSERAKCPDPANDKCQPGWILDLTKVAK